MMKKLFVFLLACVGSSSPALAEIAGAVPAAAAAASRQDALSAGQIAPDFTMRSSDGHEITLSHFKGKVVILDF